MNSLILSLIFSLCHPGSVLGLAFAFYMSFSVSWSVLQKVREIISWARRIIPLHSASMYIEAISSKFFDL